MANKLKQIFKKHEAIKWGDFILSSGKATDLYIDARKVVLCTEGISEIKRLFWRNVRKNMLTFDTIGGMQTGADAIVGSLLATKNEQLNGFLWRKEVKKHGTQQEYEGTLKPYSTIFLIDDVATSGRSLLKVAEKIRQLFDGIWIAGAFVIVDRQEGAEEALAAHDIPLYSCLTRSQLTQ